MPENDGFVEDEEEDEVDIDDEFKDNSVTIMTLVSNKIGMFSGTSSIL